MIRTATIVLALLLVAGIALTFPSGGPRCVADGGGSIPSGSIHTFPDTGTWECNNGTWVHLPSVKGL